MRRLLGGGVAALTVLMLAGGPAVAATGYPPGPPPTAACTGSAGGNLGNTDSGGSLAANVGANCFDPNSAVAVAVDSAVACRTTADSSGAVHFVITALSTSLASIRCVTGSSTGQDTSGQAAIHCAANTYAVSGTNTSDQPITVTGSFTVRCARAAGASPGTGSGSDGTPARATVLGTSVTQSGGLLPFTGAQVLGLVLLALILLAAGTVLVVSLRRRRIVV